MMESQRESPMMDLKTLRPYFFLSALTALLLSLVCGGSFLLKDIYRPFVPAQLIPAAYGQDLLSLLAVPILILSLATAWRGSLRGLISLAGLLLYIAYAYALFAFESIYDVFFFAYIALLGLSVYAFIGIVTHIPVDLYRSRIKADFREKQVSIYLFAAAVLIAATWIVILTRTIATKTLATGINTVYVLDLALLLPAFFLSALQLWRRKPIGYLLSGILLVKAVTLGLSIVLGKIATLMQFGELSIGLLGLFGILTLFGLFMLVVYLKNIEEREEVI
jgi:hypothetical protein